MRTPAGAMVLAFCLGTNVLDANAADPCAGASDNLVLVLSVEHRAHLCAQGRSARDYSVRLGSRGTGKTKAGDEKSPVGTYSLGTPRVSKKYGLFIPIGYPTKEQLRKGYSGAAVGLHGPGRAVAWLGRLNNVFDTTDGCIGIASDKEMEEIAEWVKTNHVTRIRIE